MITFTQQEARNLLTIIDRALKHAPVGGVQDNIIISNLAHKIHAVAFPQAEEVPEVTPGPPSKAKGKNG